MSLVASHKSLVGTTQMRALRADIATRHPELAVELLLMGLDGKAETVA
jgi:hypothetical protein